MNKTSHYRHALMRASKSDSSHSICALDCRLSSDSSRGITTALRYLLDHVPVDFLKRGNKQIDQLVGVRACLLVRIGGRGDLAVVGKDSKVEPDAGEEEELHVIQRLAREMALLLGARDVREHRSREVGGIQSGVDGDVDGQSTQQPPRGLCGDESVVVWKDVSLGGNEMKVRTE